MAKKTRGDSERWAAELTGSDVGEPILEDLRRRIDAGRIDLETALARARQDLQKAAEHCHAAERRRKGLAYVVDELQTRARNEDIRGLVNQGVSSDVARAHARYLKIIREASRSDITVARAGRLQAEKTAAHDALDCVCDHRFVAEVREYHTDEYSHTQIYDQRTCIICGTDLGSDMVDDRASLDIRVPWMKAKVCRDGDAAIVFVMKEEDLEKILCSPDWPLKKIIQFLADRVR